MARVELQAVHGPERKRPDEDVYGSQVRDMCSVEGNGYMMNNFRRFLWILQAQMRAYDRTQTSAQDGRSTRVLDRSVCKRQILRLS